MMTVAASMPGPQIWAVLRLAGQQESSFGEANLTRRVLVNILALSATFLTPLAAVKAQRPSGWPQSTTGMPADPAIRFGELPNGMRYAIMRNNTPPGQMAMRLYIGSGSLAETDAQQGLAHFIEHMAFRGSTHLADGALVQTLSRHGLAFGPDTNAGTGQLATVYKFDFPHSTADDLDTGLTAFREIASELTFGKASVDAERNVILSEERVRDTPAYRAQKAQIAFLLPGSKLAQRMPIGSRQVIENATPDDLRRYYAARYQPDNAVLVVVGDVDPDQVEARIKADFSSWKNAAQPNSLPAAIVAPRGASTDVALEAGAPQVMQLSWVRPFDPTPDTPAREARDLTRLVGAAILNERLHELASSDAAPFAAAAVDRSDTPHSADITTLTIVAPSARWQAALKAAVDEKQRAAAYGVTQEELNRALGRFRAGFTTAAAGAATRATPALADAIVEDVTNNGVTTSPAEDLALFDRVAPQLTPAIVSAALASDFTGSGPLLFVSAAPDAGIAKQAVQTALAADLRDSVTAQAQATQIPWPYASFGAPGTVVERKQDSNLGTETVRFANGTRLTIKRTPFSVDQVLVAVNFGRGRAGLPLDRKQAFWLIPAFMQGGTQQLTASQINRLTATHDVKVALGVADERFEFVGQTRPQDLGLELQLIAAYAADPGFRAQAVAQAQAGVSAMLPQINATAAGVLGQEGTLALHGGDPRWTTIPTAGQVAAATPADLRSIMAPALAAGPADIIITGDVAPEQAIRAVATTYGALPSRTPVQRSAPEVSFPKPTATPVVFRHAGRADQAILLTAWHTNDLMSSPRDAYAVDALAGVLRQRLIEQVRTKLGATYTPEVQSDASPDVPGYGYLEVAIELPPDKLATVRQTLASIVDDLKSEPVSADELLRAKAPLLDKMQREEKENSFWLKELSAAQGDPAKLKLIRTRTSLMQGVSAADVQRVARAYLADNRRYEMNVLPQGGLAQATAPHAP